MEWLKSKFELSRSGTSNNLKSMEGLRGVAVFLVFIVHYVALVSPRIMGDQSLYSLALGMEHFGHTGVDLFFVLSGYLIYGSLITRKQNFFQFMKNRISRIYPTFTVIFLVYIALSFVFPNENKIPNNVFSAFIYLLENYLLLPGLFPIIPMITVSWTLSYEMFYYLAIPILVSTLALQLKSFKWRINFFLIIALALLAYCSIFDGHVRLVMFISGVLLFETINNFKKITISNSMAFVCILISFSSALLPSTNFLLNSVKALLLFMTHFFICYTCFTQTNGWFTNIFLFTPLRWLGNMSYSYYLVHGLALKALFLVLQKIAPTLAFDTKLYFTFMLLFFVFTLIPSALLFLIIERPFSIILKPRKNNG